MRPNEPLQLIADLLAELRKPAFPSELVAGLCDLVTSDDEAAAIEASNLFFSDVIEPLSDSFSVEDASIYNRLFARVVDCCRLSSRGREIGLALRSFGLTTERELIARADRLNRRSPEPLAEKSKIKAVIIVSRVTVGADVAITSVIGARFEHELPDAEIILFGGDKLRELFGGDPRIRFEEFNYQRSGNVIDRLLIWTKALDQIRAISNQFREGECIVVDPDSRITQLGLLPLTNDGEYLFFPSRTYKSQSSAALAQLTSHWLDELTGNHQQTLPIVRPASRDVELATNAIHRLRGRVTAPIVTVNFGVGENDSKRVGDCFEAELIATLIDCGARVILDRGAGALESARADSTVSAARRLLESHEPRVVEATEASLRDFQTPNLLDCNLLIWSGRVGLLAAFIGAGDLYIGYDSAGQHIAAALGTPCIDIFAGAVSERFRERWAPTGPGVSRVIDAAAKSPQDVLRETTQVARDLVTRLALT